MSLPPFSLRAANLKCFGSEPQGFDSVHAINLIIGRNNAGKSALLDMVRYAIEYSHPIPASNWNGQQPAKIFVDTAVTEQDIADVFPDKSGGPIEGNHRVYGQQFIGQRVRVELSKDAKHTFVQFLPTPGNPIPNIATHAFSEYAQRLMNLPSRHPLGTKYFARLGAERNISPEPETGTALQEDGTGATNLIREYLLKASRPSELVQTTMREALNTIFGADANFTSITCLQREDNNWEIYLTEAAKGRIALSQSGSGLKTVILVLCFLHLRPVSTTQPLNHHVFAFEELENNLHPALLRRLLSYIADQAAAHGFIVFTTTHSSVAIDMFNTRRDAQIIHVTHDGSSATCKTARAYLDHW